MMYTILHTFIPILVREAALFEFAPVNALWHKLLILY